MLVVNHFNTVARLYDQTRDNPVEVTVGRAGDDGVALVVIDRDEGNIKLSITVLRSELEAALALTRVVTICEDCHT